jgi:glycosyltransferase involved in cell wall biosynthesis
LITLTPGLKKDIAEKLRLTAADKIEVVPLGLDLEKNWQYKRKSSNWRQKIGLSSESFLMGIVARLVPVKNHRMLIDAMPELCRRFPNLHLAVVGGGELESSLKSRVDQHGLSGRIHFAGIERDIENVYSDLDLLVLSSKNEGTPVVIIEALASGCPVAATGVGGVAEVLEHGRLGALLRTDPELFAQDLATVIAAGPAGPATDLRKHVVNSYSIELLVNRLHQLYYRQLRLRGIDIG